MIVDINHFTTMVRRTWDTTSAILTRDILEGAIERVEQNGGEVVGFMGDAFLALLDSVDSVFTSCVGIAKNVDDVCSYFSEAQRTDKHAWPHLKGGPSLKIMVEYGHIDTADIQSRRLGKQTLFVGDALNTASRLGRAGKGNRCLLGERAGPMIGKIFTNVTGPFNVRGKRRAEGTFRYYKLDLGDIWKEGPLGRGEDTYWG